MSRRRHRKGRNIHGVLLLDKPAGLTSNEALQKVKRLFNAQKAGHTGSLDKTATGLLPICFGEATKFSAFLLDADKHYRAECRLGELTTTGDAAGEVIEKSPVPELDKQLLESVLEEFLGEIEQVPPMYSALKHKGKRLYSLAYQGIEVEREPRKISIFSLQLCNFDKETIEIDVVCSKGTYIRTLAEDIGKKIGCGAHVISLRRLGSGPYKAADMVKIEDIEQLAESGTHNLDKLLLGIDSAVSNLPQVTLDDNLVYYLRQGQAVLVAGVPTCGDLRLYDSQQRFLGLAKVLDDGRIAPRRLIALGNN